MGDTVQLTFANKSYKFYCPRKGETIRALEHFFNKRVINRDKILKLFCLLHVCKFRFLEYINEKMKKSQKCIVRPIVKLSKRT